MTRWTSLADKEKSKRLNFEMILEEDQMEYSVNRFWKGVEIETEATPALQQLVKEYISQTVDSYQFWLDELSKGFKTTSKNANWPLLLFSLGPEKSAAITVISIIRMLYADSYKSDDLFGLAKLSNLSHQIGQTAKNVIAFEQAKTTYREDFLRQSNYQKNWTPRRCVAFAKKMQTVPNLPVSDFRHFGINCLKIAEAAGLINIHNITEYDRKSPKTVGVVELVPEVYKQAAMLMRATELNSIVYRPMLVPPVPHTFDESGGLLADYMRKGTVSRSHGFGKNETYLINNNPTEYSKGSSTSEVSLRGLNYLQETEWKIETNVLETMKTLFRNDTREGMLPAWSFNAFSFDSEYPEDGTMQDQINWKKEKEEAYSQWFKEEQKRTVLHTRLSLAEKIVGYGNFFYHAQSQDFRGRTYCDTVLLNPQSSDFDRSLIQFSESQKQTDEGLYWLKVHIANLFDIDKVSFAERVDWVDVHLKDLLSVADNPYDTRSFWVDNETVKKNTTWQRLNAINDLKQSLEKRLTNTPVQLDGSNNGAQHWAAIMRDSSVARLTNLQPTDQPQDLYQVIADIATKTIEHSNHPIHFAIRQRWPNGIPRKVGKRPGMCYGYGITRYGCRKYMKEEGHLNSSWVPKEQMTAYQNELGNLIYDSLGELMELPNQGKSFVQECARVVMEQADVKRLVRGEYVSVTNPFISWITPTGFQAVNTYWESQPSVVYSNLYTRREVHYRDYVDDAGSRRDGIAAFAPNFIHSLDAAHLIMVVNRLREEYGITQFSMVHDSFGVPAPFVPQLRQVTREVFHEIHKVNQLQVLKDHVEETFNVSLPPVPEVGTFDVSQILEAEYMFA